MLAAEYPCHNDVFVIMIVVFVFDKIKRHLNLNLNLIVDIFRAHQRSSSV